MCDKSNLLVQDVYNFRQDILKMETKNKSFAYFFKNCNEPLFATWQFGMDDKNAPRLEGKEVSHCW